MCIQSLITTYAPLPETYKLRYVISGVSLANGFDDTFYYTEAFIIIERFVKTNSCEYMFIYLRCRINYDFTKLPDPSTKYPAAAYSQHTTRRNVKPISNPVTGKLGHTTNRIRPRRSCNNSHLVLHIQHQCDTRSTAV